MTAQLVHPNPNIWCRPGWCLQYVREAFGITPGVQPTATAGWNASPTKHRDRNFPTGVWHPVWFSLKNVPAGHVALRAPNGNVYSTSDDNNTPHCHPDLDDLINYYNRYGQPITYLGWTEDIENVTVIDLDNSIDYDGQITIPTEEDDMFTDADRDKLEWVWNQLTPGKSGYKEAGPVSLEITAAKTAAEAGLAQMLPGESGVRNAGAVYAALAGLKGADAGLDPKALAAAIIAALPADLAKQVVAELGSALGGE